MLDSSVVYSRFEPDFWMTSDAPASNVLLANEYRSLLIRWLLKCKGVAVKFMLFGAIVSEVRLW